MRQEIRLDVGFGAGTRVLVVVVGIVVALVAAFAVALVGGMLSTFAPPAVAAAVAIVLGAGLLYLLLRLVLRYLRAAGRLVGSTLMVVDAFATRRSDLASAQLSLDEVSESRWPGGRVRVPLLIAREPAGGRRVSLRLRRPGGDLLPADQLDALAAAIESGIRPEPEATRSREVASSLRHLTTRS